MKGIIKDAVILFIITVIAGVCLGAVHDITLEPIAKAQEAARTATYQEVYPDAASFAANEELTQAIAASAQDIAAQGFGNVTVDSIEEAKDASGNVIGYLLTSTSAEGYGGSIQIAVGITKEGSLTGIGFLSISETAGLGMNAQNPKFKDQFAEKAAQVFEVTKTGATADNQINAITGATVTSSAVTGAVNAAVYFYENCVAQ